MVQWRTAPCVLIAALTAAARPTRYRPRTALLTAGALVAASVVMFAVPAEAPLDQTWPGIHPLR
jgi:hypothetical protein